MVVDVELDIVWDDGGDLVIDVDDVEVDDKDVDGDWFEPRPSPGNNADEELGSRATMILLVVDDLDDVDDDCDWPPSPAERPTFSPKVALGVRGSLDEPTDRPRSTPAAIEADALSKVIALLLDPRLRFKPTPAVAVLSGSIGPIVMEPEELRLRSAPTVALAITPRPLEPVESPRFTPAVTDGTAAKDAEMSMRVIVLLPTPTPMPTLPPTPTEGVIAASMQMLSTFPPAEHEAGGTEVIVAGWEEPDRPGFKPTLALAPTPTPPVPTEMPRSALAAAEGATARLVDTSMIVMVLLPRPALIPPPAPTDGVIAASRQISSTLSYTEQVPDEDAAVIIVGKVNRWCQSA